jgi:hypothetical protein
MNELKDSLYIGFITFCSVSVGITLTGIVENRHYDYSQLGWLPLTVFGSLGSFLAAKYKKI